MYWNCLLWDVKDRSKPCHLHMYMYKCSPLLVEQSSSGKKHLVINLRHLDKFLWKHNDWLQCYCWKDGLHVPTLIISPVAISIAETDFYGQNVNFVCTQGCHLWQYYLWQCVFKALFSSFDTGVVLVTKSKILPGPKPSLKTMAWGLHPAMLKLSMPPI